MTCIKNHVGNGFFEYFTFFSPQLMQYVSQNHYRIFRGQTVQILKRAKHVYLAARHLQTNTEGMQLWSPLLSSFWVGQMARGHSSNKWWVQSSRQKHTKRYVCHKSLDYSLHEDGQKNKVYVVRTIGLKGK
jgi:hypothetical protein